MTRKDRRLTLILHNEHGQVGPRNLGTLTVLAEEPVASRSVVDITFRCTRLDDKDLFSKSVCFQISISKIFNFFLDIEINNNILLTHLANCL